MLERVLKQIEKEDIRDVHRQRPLQARHLNELVQKIYARRKGGALSLEEHRIIVLLYLMHDCLLRVGEVLSLTRGDISFSERESVMHVTILRSKANQAGPPETISIRERKSPNAVSAMKSWLALSKNGQSAHSSPLFGVCLSYHYVSKTVKWAASTIGLNPSSYNTHSMRAGGATDLFVARVPYYIIKKMGRWKSDAALIYYRDHSDVLDAVAAGMQQLFERDG